MEFIKTKVKPKIDNLIENLDKIGDKIGVQVKTATHGSYTHFEKKGTEYISDVDSEIWVRYQNNNEQIVKLIQETVQYLLSTGLIFGSFKTGDIRFKFSFWIDKKGNVREWDAIEIENTLKKYLELKYISDKEYRDLKRYIIKNPSLLDAQNFILALETYYFIDWTPEEIMKGYKTHYGKKVFLEKTMMVHAVISSYVLQIDVSNYITFDLSYRIVWFPDEYKTFEASDYAELADFISKRGKFMNEADLHNSNYHHYLGIYKNYAEKKYLKIYKRIRSLLSQMLFRKGHNIINNSNYKSKHPKNDKIIKKWRYIMNETTGKGEVGYLNMVKNKFDISMILLKRLPKKDADKIIRKIIPNQFLPKDITEENLKIFKNKIMDKLNEIMYEPLKDALKGLKDILPFTLII